MRNSSAGDEQVPSRPVRASLHERRAESLVRLTQTGLYLVTDDRLPLPALLDKTRLALAAGVRVVQYREKRVGRREALARARQLQGLCAAEGALFLVNDDIDVALAVGADGVHLGQDDFPPEEARSLLGDRPLIGLSVSASAEASTAERLPVDYLGVGAMYPTDTKPDAEFGGLQLLRSVRRALSLPLVAIGGISLERVPEVVEAGADGVAVVSAVYGATDPAATVHALLAAVAEARTRPA